MGTDILWLGLHKTGTTFLQKSLNLSQKVLRQGAIHYVDLDEFRRCWTRPLLHKNHAEAPAQALLPEGMDRWLVFDENILALVQHGLTRHGFYPDAGPRASIISDYLGLRAPRIVLGLRSCASLVPSLYCEALKSTPFKTFQSFLQQPVEEISWLPLIERLQATFPESELLLYRAEDLSGQEGRLLSAVTGLPAAAFTLLDKPERVGFSHAAVSHLHALAERGPVSRDMVRETVRDLPRGPERPGYAPWSSEDRAILDATYARDIAVLRKKAHAASAEHRITFLNLVEDA
jgi:hypothetical protein